MLKQRIAGNMLKMNRVHGVGVGLRDPKRPKRGAAIIAYANPMSKAAPAPKNKSTRTTALPRYLKPRAGVPFRIIRSPRFCKRTGNGLGGRFTRRIRPVVADYSVGTPDSSGTVGLIVSSDASGCERLIPSNNHVLVDNNTRRFSATLQPGGADGGTLAKDRIGQLDRFVKLSRKRANYLDAATITFKNQSVIRGKRPVSLEDDSGSIWLTSKGNLAAAVNFAGSENGMLSISYPIEWFMQVFGTRVAKPLSGRLLRAKRGKNSKFMCIRPLPAKLANTLRPITASPRPLRRRATTKKAP